MKIAIGNMLTPSQVAKMFGVDTKTVARWAKSGRLTAVMTPGGHRRYEESHIREVMARKPE